jgi:hypothetical protein
MVSVLRKSLSASFAAILEIKTHGTNRTRMYKKRISDWNLQKNYNVAQMQRIASILQQHRDSSQRLPRLLLNGEDVDLSRVRRFYRDRCDDKTLRK